jgi:predicted acetyltransferase
VKLTTTVITDPMVLDTESSLDTFIENYSNIPFIFSSFIKNAMFQKANKNQTPTVVIVKLNKEIVGVAPLLLKHRVGMRYCEPLFDFWSSIDFVINDKYRKTVINHIVNLIFKRLRCKYSLIYFSDESPNLNEFKQICMLNKFNCFETKDPSMDHWIIPVNCSWTEFQKSKGRIFRKKLRSTERKLNDAGKWNLFLIENHHDSLDGNSAIDKVLAIDRQSWKSIHRRLLGLSDEDEDLVWFLKSSSSNKDNPLSYRCKIWFLELEHQPIAYTMSFHYKGTAFFVKTSFIEKYRNLTPGKFVKKAAIKDIFDKKEEKTIDFMTNMPLVGFWGTSCLPRVRIIFGYGPMFKLLLEGRNFYKALRPDIKFESDSDYWLTATARAQLQSAQV